MRNDPKAAIFTTSTLIEKLDRMSREIEQIRHMRLKLGFRLRDLCEVYQVDAETMTRFLNQHHISNKSKSS